MKERRKDCKYCGKELTEGNTNREFCSPKHRVYWNRENKKGEVQNVAKPITEVKAPDTTKVKVPVTGKHPLWKEGDPKEGSGAFYMRYGVSTYDELEKSKRKIEK